VAQTDGDLVEAEHRFRAALGSAERPADMRLSGSISEALGEVLTAAGRPVEGLPYSVAAWRVLRQDESEAESVVAVLHSSGGCSVRRSSPGC
jgi:hypothetical protein